MSTKSAFLVGKRQSASRISTSSACEAGLLNLEILCWPSNVVGPSSGTVDDGGEGEGSEMDSMEEDRASVSCASDL